MSPELKKEMAELLSMLVAPFPIDEQAKVRACLNRQGGLERCSLSFYREGDLGDDGEWDNWRLEGPAFVWYFRGTPHVHAWVHVADDLAAPSNPQNGRFVHPDHDPLDNMPVGSPPAQRSGGRG
jgi:hypothetical protein